MDGENNGKPYFQMDDLGVPLFLETPKLCEASFFLTTFFCSRQFVLSIGLDGIFFFRNCRGFSSVIIWPWGGMFDVRAGGSSFFCGL